VPELPVISSQAEFADRCSGALPCLILLLQGDGEVHSPGLVPKLAKLLAGDRILGAIVDVGKWRAPLIQLQAQAPSAMFVGPFGSEGSYIANRMPDLAPNKEFTVRADFCLIMPPIPRSFPPSLPGPPSLPSAAGELRDFLARPTGA